MKLIHVDLTCLSGKEKEKKKRTSRSRPNLSLFLEGNPKTFRDHYFCPGKNIFYFHKL